jgi:hypothetical protein
MVQLFGSYGVSRARSGRQSIRWPPSHGLREIRPPSRVLCESSYNTRYEHLYLLLRLRAASDLTALDQTCFKDLDHQLAGHPILFARKISGLPLPLASGITPTMRKPSRR